MLLPATHVHHLFSPLPSSSSSSLSFFPVPISKTRVIPRNPTNPKFIVRSSAADTNTLPKSAIQRIADKLRTLGFTEETSAPPEYPPPTSAGEIFVPLPHHLPKQRVGHTIDPSWSTPENPVPQPGTGTAIVRHVELSSEVEKQKKLERNKNKREERAPTLAELSLSDGEIRRLTTLGIRMKQKLKIGKAGITEGIVNGIHERWRSSEVVRIVCEDICKLNMKRTHKLLERKTGGLVVWRSGSKIILYRGTDYKYPYFLSDKVLIEDNLDDALQHSDSDKTESNSSHINSVTNAGQSSNPKTAKPSLIQGVGTPNKVRFQLPGEAELAEEADRLLTGLGPRFTDWWGYDPLPVDADLLPAVIPGYRKPFRLLPYGVRSKLTDDEMTTLRRLGRHLPCHFALGRNRKLQGLAAGIIKLWERCEIVKIAIKRGVQNTNSELMADELKHLTGGTLLARDREFIVFYRGKDFLPSAVSSAIEQRRNIGMYKEKVTAENSSLVIATPDPKHGIIEGGPKGNCMACHKDASISEERILTEAAIKRTSFKLSVALEKKAKAEKLLEELEKAEKPQEPEIDKEGLTKEEMYMLRKIGLKMNPFLLLGRRGVFDGTVENMHLHWKYRELVKIICKEGNLEAVHQIARTLEAESGGILIAVERVSKGYAIIVYRGKNYSRPACLRPQTLLSKREALKRSKEAQRRESLKLHVLELNKNINELKLQMVKDKEANSKRIAEESRFDPARDKQGACSNSINLNSPKEPSVSNQQAIQQQEVVLIDDGCAHQGEPESGDLQTRDKHGAGSNFINFNSSEEASVNNQQAIPQQEVELINDDQARQGEPDSRAGLIHKETQLDGESGSLVVDSRHCISNNKAMESSVTSPKSDTEPSALVINRSSNGLPSRSVHLSNRERLLLRKQALKMIKRPVLAVGKSNIVTGVAKTIKAHFKKHPLAIVNVKGRAKGTSVQEVVFQLEQATGAVLVSQEPSKVILYRGWGAGEKPGTEINVNDMGQEGGAKPNVSPELLEAIKVECGLQ